MNILSANLWNYKTYSIELYIYIGLLTQSIVIFELLTPLGSYMCKSMYGIPRQ